MPGEPAGRPAPAPAAPARNPVAPDRPLTAAERDLALACHPIAVACARRLWAAWRPEPAARCDFFAAAEDACLRLARSPAFAALAPADRPRAVWPAVRSACRNALRAFRRANAPPKAPTPDPPLPPPVAARLVRLLTPREARILALTYGRRLDPDATARELNLSPATVAWHLAKALAKLRRLARKEPPPCSPPTPPPPTPPDLS